MANLIIDIGNTALKACWTSGITLGKIFRYQGEGIVDFILSLTSKEKPQTIVLCSVRNLSPQSIKRISSQCERLVIVNEDISASHNIPSYISPDRAASIIASRFLFNKRNCTIFDFGTVLTVDFVDAEGQYKGGNISPGLRTRFKAVNRYAKSIPLVDIPEETVETGTDVATSVSSGVISGIMFEIEGYMSHHPENINVFTGGDAIYFAKRMKNSIFVVCNLVLMGLALIAVEYD